MTKTKLKLGLPFYATGVGITGTLIGWIAFVGGSLMAVLSVAAGNIEFVRYGAVEVLLGIGAIGLFSEMSRYSIDRWRASNGLEPYEWE